jgi:hypothetical protein
LVQDLQDLKQIMHEVQTENGDVKKWMSCSVVCGKQPSVIAVLLTSTKEKMDKSRGRQTARADQSLLNPAFVWIKIAQTGRRSVRRKTDRIGSNGTTTDESSLPPF